jgi:hypothetical protein
MKLAVSAGDWVQWSWQVLLCVMLVQAPLAARADRWLVEDNLRTRFESNDNAALAAISAGMVHTLYLSGALDASRQMENTVTRLKTDATAVRQWGAGARNRMDGQLALSHSLNDELNTFNFGLRSAQDFNNVVTNADITQGQGQRRTTALSAAWSRAWSERLSANTQLLVGRTTYGTQLANAVNYRDSTLSAGLSYALSETTSLGLQASRSKYRAADDRNQSKTDSINLSLSNTTSERASGSVSLGTYRTHSAVVGTRLACPLAAAFCDAGLVPYQRVDQTRDTSRRGLQFNGAYRLRLDETTDSAFSAARQQAPSGAGTVVRNDTLTLGVNRTLSPTLTGSMSYARSRSSFQTEPAAASPSQATFSASLAKQLAANLSFQVGYQHSRAYNPVSGNASSNSLSISLQYDGPKIDVSR